MEPDDLLADTETSAKKNDVDAWEGNSERETLFP